MGIGLLMTLASPVTWLLIAAAVSVWRRSKWKNAEAHLAGTASSGPAAGSRQLGVIRGAALDVGAAFLFLSVAYRPNHAFLVKAQIREVEDVDEDGRGGPDTPQRHLLRQLRQIRRGRHVEQLVWRLE